MHGFISGLSILSHWSVCLFLCQYHVVLIEGQMRRGQQRMIWLYSITESMDMNLSKLQEIMKDREAWHTAVHRSHDESDTTYQQNNKISRDNFTSSFWFVWHFFSYPIAMDRTLSTTLNKNHESALYHFVSDLREKVFSFSQSSMLLLVGLSYMAFIILRCIPSTPN